MPYGSAQGQSLRMRRQFPRDFSATVLLSGWEDIREIRLHKRMGALELRGDGKKLIVESRFVARAHLPREIEQRNKAPTAERLTIVVIVVISRLN